MRNVLAFLALLFLAPAALAHPGWGVAEDQDGNLYYTDLEQVWRVASDGTRSVVVADVHTHELFIDADGNLIGEHLWYSGGQDGSFSHRVWQLDQGGSLTTLREASGFRSDDSFVRDAAGNAYWHDGSTLFRRGPDGDSAPHGAIAFGAINALAAAKDGSVFLVDDGDLVMLAPGGAERLRLSDFAEGRLTQPMVAAQHRILGLWPASDGAVYAAQFGARRVDKVAHDGTVETIATTWLPWAPTGGIETRSGDVWLLEYSLLNEARLRKVGEAQPVSWGVWAALILPLMALAWGLQKLFRRRRSD